MLSASITQLSMRINISCKRYTHESTTHLKESGYVHTVLDVFSTGRKFRPDTLYTRNRSKVLFCSDGTNRIDFATFLSVLPSPHAQNAS